jgi:hypothetical protein
MCSPEKMGILDNVLRPHLEAITKVYKANELELLSKHESDKIQQINSEKNAKIKRQRLDNESEDFRQLGNNAYKAKDLNQALYMYTKSIAAAMEGPLASLAYFNRCDPIKISLYKNKVCKLFICTRSAALFQMKLFEDCIIDIDRALASGYPKKQQLYSLYLRKARCLKFLRKDFTDCLSEAMKV